MSKSPKAAPQAAPEKQPPTPVEAVPGIVKQAMLGFTGIVHTAVAARHADGRPNFRLVTVRLEQGRIVETVNVSDTYMFAEASVRLELRNDSSLQKLNRAYPSSHPDGVVVLKGFTE